MWWGKPHFYFTSHNSFCLSILEGRGDRNQNLDKAVFISDLKEGVFFAKILCDGEKGDFTIDARPSDAIAIGLRFNVPIYTNESILTEAGIVLTDDAEDEIAKLKKTSGTGEEVPAASEGEKLDKISFDKLEKMLNEALEKEDYERAAKIRDEMNRRN